jgi:hypothetical protein
MSKTIKVEVEVTFDESVEQRLIQIAREHYCEVGKATAPLDDKGDRWREIPAEEFIPDAVAAIIELIGANDLLEEAGVEVTAVSVREPWRERSRPQEDSKAVPPAAEQQGGLSQATNEPHLDEFETGVYLCRWPNGDFSLVTANTRREALVALDEWGGAHPTQLSPIDAFMVDFSLNDQGEIELAQFGGETEHLVWEICYPELHEILSSTGAEDAVNIP